MKGVNYAQKHHFYMPDRTGPHFRGSKHPGGRIQVSGLDHFNVTGLNAFWDSGDRGCGRLVVKIPEAE
jgi:hypothetical protein